MDKIAVCVPPAWCDAYGHLTRYAEQLAETGAGRGAAVDILHYDAPDFMARLFTALQDEDAVVHFHAFLYDLAVSTSPARTRRIHVLEKARATVLATISDHPFTDFMQDMIRDAHPNTNFIVLEKTFPDEMQAINPALKAARFDYQPFGPPQNYDSAYETGFADRQFDLVIPVRIVDLTDRDINVLLGKLGTTWLVKAMSATYETCVADISRNPFHIFLEHMSAALGGASFADIREHKPEAAGAILNAISAVDGLVRQERRHRMVKSLLRSVGDLKVAVLCEPIPSLDADEKVQFLGARQTPDTIKLMADTRALLNCNPTYPSNLHERVTVGMMYGSCVITDVNPYIAENFTSQEFLSYIPGSPRTIADLFADHDIEAVGSAAAAKVHGDRAFSWEGHFDELTRVVTASRANRLTQPRAEAGRAH
ncbi:MAG: hypothetical protein ACYCZX_03220 [Rhodospirillaceae bacterium]